MTRAVIKLEKQKLKMTNKEGSVKSANVKQLLRHWARPAIIDNILYREKGETHNYYYHHSCTVQYRRNYTVRWDTLA